MSRYHPDAYLYPIINNLTKTRDRLKRELRRVEKALDILNWRVMTPRRKMSAATRRKIGQAVKATLAKKSRLQSVIPIKRRAA